MARLWRAVAVVGLLLGLLPIHAAVGDESPLSPTTPARRVFGYYVPYDPTSWASLEAHPEALDAVGAQWVTIDACGNLSSRDDQTLKQFARAQGIAVFPSLLTTSGELNHRLLTEEGLAARAIEQIVGYVEAEGYDGFDLDLEAVQAQDRPAYTAFVAALAAALHARGKPLALALPAKTRDVTTGWAGAYDYAALGQQADLITVMAYEYHGAWGGPGSIAPYDWVENVTAFATSQVPPEKVQLGLAFYAYDWNVTSGGARAMGYPSAARLAERYQAPITLDPATRSATFRYQALAGDSRPAAPAVPPPQHEITTREAPPCPVVLPAPPRPTPRPLPPPDQIQEHEVWLEESASAAARLGLAAQYGAGGVATWRLGQEDPAVWTMLREWRGLR